MVLYARELTLRQNFEPVLQPLLDHVEVELADAGDNRLVRLRVVRQDGNYTDVCGLRNSHDKAFAAEYVCGTRVFVCDNLAFSGDVRIARKHTTHILRDMGQLVMDALSKFQIEMIANDTRFEAYKQTTIKDATANALVIEMFRSQAITTLRIPGIVKEWYEPTHAEHAEDGRNVWRLFNAATETLKNEGGLMQLPAYTKRLTSLMDRYCIDQGTLELPQLVDLPLAA